MVIKLGVASTYPRSVKIYLLGKGANLVYYEGIASFY